MFLVTTLANYQFSLLPTICMCIDGMMGIYFCFKYICMKAFYLFHCWHIIIYLVQYIGSPVLGYLTAGILIGPYGLSIIHNVHGTKAIAEFGVVFLLFNIGLEVEILNLE